MIKIILKAITITLIISLNTYAHNNVVVVPLGDDAAPLKNVIRVSAKNGDFTNIAEAIASITNSSSGNPYLVVLGPGQHTVFTNTLTIPPYVNLVGSGINQTSVLAQLSKASNFEDAAVLLVSNGASVSNMSIFNLGLPNAGHNVVGLALKGFSSASNIKIVVSSNITRNYGLYASGNEITLTDSEIIATDGTHSYGAFADGGIFNIRESSIIGGVATTESYGAIDTSIGSLTIRNSVINSTGTGIEINNTATKIIQSEVNGDIVDWVDNQGGTSNCLDVYTGSVSFNSGC